MSANNVVQGPWGQLPPSPDDKEVSVDIQNKLVQIVNVCMDEMERLGVDTLDEEGYIKDLALVAESIRSYLLKTRNKYHRAQDLAEALFYWQNGSLQMVQSINLEFDNGNR
jgi:hypothetical protein